MTEFWEFSFQDKQTMWGFEAADAAIDAANFFQQKGLKKILIPGFGYGRNAKAFTDQGMEVSGIEISQTAIELARKHYGGSVKVYHGGVGEMPFDDDIYEGIFCYALIHLLDEKERNKLIEDCYAQLKTGAYMYFVAISTADPAYGRGELTGKNRYLTRHGVKLYFYDDEAISQEFGNYGLLEAKEISEPAQVQEGKRSQKFWKVICKKG